jgi:hypothetical protein
LHKENPFQAKPAAVFYFTFKPLAPNEVYKSQPKFFASTSNEIVHRSFHTIQTTLQFDLLQLLHLRNYIDRKRRAQNLNEVLLVLKRSRSLLKVG